MVWWWWSMHETGADMETDQLCWEAEPELWAAFCKRRKQPIYQSNVWTVEDVRNWFIATRGNPMYHRAKKIPYPKQSVGVTIADQEFVVVYDYTVLSRGSRPKTYGPPEHCDPGSDPEIAFEIVSLHQDLGAGMCEEALGCPPWLESALMEYLDECQNVRDYVLDDENEGY